MLVTPSLRLFELVIYNWPYYLAPEVKSLFTQETASRRAYPPTRARISRLQRCRKIRSWTWP